MHSRTWPALLAISAFTLSLSVASFGADNEKNDDNSKGRKADGAVFVMSNDAEKNEIVAFKRRDDGTLKFDHRYSAHGSGQGVDFDTQGGLTLSSDHRFLYACNPGTDDVAVFSVEGSKLRFLQLV